MELTDRTYACIPSSQNRTDRTLNILCHIWNRTERTYICIPTLRIELIELLFHSPIFGIELKELTYVFQY